MWSQRKLTPEEKIASEFLERHGYLPDLNLPRTFSEKIQYRKLHDRDMRIRKLSDKVEVKSHIATHLGSEWTVPTLWFGTTLPPRDLRNWRRPYVLKASHGHGWNIFVGDEDEEWEKIERTTNLWLSSVFGTKLQEWGYWQIEPRLLVEPFIGENLHVLPIDYKFLVFAGRTRFICVIVDRQARPHRGAIYDRDWVKQDAHYATYPNPESISPPKSLDKMLWAADKLGSEFSFVRVDFYEVNGTPLIGELTFYPASGYVPFCPFEFDERLGSLWNYP